MIGGRLELAVQNGHVDISPLAKVIARSQEAEVKPEVAKSGALPAGRVDLSDSIVALKTEHPRRSRPADRSHPSRRRKSAHRRHRPPRPGEESGDRRNDRPHQPQASLSRQCRRRLDARHRPRHLAKRPSRRRWHPQTRRHRPMGPGRPGRFMQSRNRTAIHRRHNSYFYGPRESRQTSSHQRCLHSNG